jgi:putative nucleotidyltransferase with HDIG domain
VLETALLIVAGWIVVSGAAYLLVLPMLTASERSDRLGAAALRHPAAQGRDRPRLQLVRESPEPEPRRWSAYSPSYSGLVLDRLIRHALTVLAAEEASVLVAAPGDDALTVAGAVGRDEELVGLRLPADRLAPGTAFSSGRFVVVPLADGSACAAAPVGVAGTPRAVLAVTRRAPGARFEVEDLDLLGELSSLVGTALEHHERRELAASDPSAEIRMLASALGELDVDTLRHCGDVAAMARRVGERMGLELAELLEVEVAALLHDVGKLRVPRAILRKAGPLTDEEREVVRLHPVWGAEIVARIPGCEAVALIVRLHHERPDGSGYPHRLAGERVPVASRIVAACDVWGAMTVERPYRRALDAPAALAELERAADGQLDPGVVRALADVVPAGAAA